MKQLFTSFFAAACLLSATSAFAGPPARENTSQPCAHCIHASGPATRAVHAHAGQFGAQRPCNHGLVAKGVRWGNSQKPCAHCTHMG
jgi:hypothetical protein